MPKTLEEQKKFRAIAFGDADWPEAMKYQIAESAMSPRMVAMGMCSDLQEELQHNVGDALSVNDIRVKLNQIKWVISEYLVTKPSNAERQLVTRFLDFAVDKERDQLLWLLDSRR